MAPSHTSHGSFTHQRALLKQQHKHVLLPVLVCLTLAKRMLHGEQEDSRLSNAAASQGRGIVTTFSPEPGSVSVSSVFSVSYVHWRVVLTCQQQALL